MGNGQSEARKFSLAQTKHARIEPVLPEAYFGVWARESKGLKSVISILETTAADGKNYPTRFYNLDAVIGIAYRVNPRQATECEATPLNSY